MREESQISDSAAVRRSHDPPLIGPLTPVSLETHLQGPKLTDLTPHKYKYMYMYLYPLKRGLQLMDTCIHIYM